MSKHKMKRHTKAVLVVLVLVSAAGGAAYHFLGGGPAARADRVVARISDRLDLDANQRGRLDLLKSEVMALRAEARAGRADVLDQLVEVLLAPTLDQAELLDMLEQRTRTVRDRAPAVVETLAAFTDSLTPVQKSEIGELIASRRQRWGSMLH